MKDKNNGLRLGCLAIGSLPHKDVDLAMSVVDENFKIPFWPQLAKFNKNEDMILQFLESMPGLVNNASEDKIYLENESDEFFEQLETLFMDFEEIVSEKNYENLAKYAISREYSSSIQPFLKIVEKNQPKFAKGQIVGPFTLATTLCDKEGRCAFYDETLREIVLKTLALKAIWQINEIKKVSPSTTPIIFIDEPSISQLGTSAFITISRDEVVSVLKEVSDIIKAKGAMSAIHCCGKCDWTVPIESGVDILNLDGYFFAQNLSLFAEDIKKFLAQDRFIAWGIVPTLDSCALEKADISVMLAKFDEAIGYLISKCVDKELLLNQSIVTPSCGAGSLTVELAEKAMKLTKELSVSLINKYSGE